VRVEVWPFLQESDYTAYPFLSDYEESQSESEAISSSRQDALRHIKSPLMSPQSATSETEEESRDGKLILHLLPHFIYFRSLVKHRFTLYIF